MRQADAENRVMNEKGLTSGQKVEKTVEKIAVVAAAPRKRGAPTIKTPELLDAIFAGISLGKSARAMCIEVGISQRVLWNWLASDEELMRQYLHAKELCVDAYAEEIIEISGEGQEIRMLMRRDGSHKPGGHSACSITDRCTQMVCRKTRAKEIWRQIAGYT